MFRLIPVIALCIAALALGGCYSSNSLLLDAGSAATPLSTGEYRRGTDRLHLTQESNGWYSARNYNKDGSMMSGSSRVLFNRAYDVGSGSQQVYYYASEDEDIGWVYGLIVVDGSAVYDVWPNCDNGTASAIANSEGAKFYEDDEFGNECVFADAGALRRALARFYQATPQGNPYYRQ